MIQATEVDCKLFLIVLKDYYYSQRRHEKGENREYTQIKTSILSPKSLQWVRTKCFLSPYNSGNILAET